MHGRVPAGSTFRVKRRDYCEHERELRSCEEDAVSVYFGREHGDVILFPKVPKFANSSLNSLNT